MHLSKTRIRNVIVFVKMLQYKWHGIIIVLPNNIKDTTALSISKFHKNFFFQHTWRSVLLFACMLVLYLEYTLKSKDLRCVTYNRNFVWLKRECVSRNKCIRVQKLSSKFGYSRKSTLETRYSTSHKEQKRCMITV